MFPHAPWNLGEEWVQVVSKEFDEPKLFARASDIPAEVLKQKCAKRRRPSSRCMESSHEGTFKKLCLENLQQDGCPKEAKDFDQEDKISAVSLKEGAGE